MELLNGTLGPDHIKRIITTELKEAGITPQLLNLGKRKESEFLLAKIANTKEVMFYQDLIGELNDFTFRRASNFWEVKGKLPIRIAAALYEHPASRVTIRVNGNFNCPNPMRYATYYNKEGKVLLHKEEKEKMISMEMGDFLNDLLEGSEFVDSPSAVGQGFVEMYHVYNQEALNMFAYAIRSI